MDERERLMEMVKALTALEVHRLLVMAETLLKMRCEKCTKK